MSSLAIDRCVPHDMRVDVIQDGEIFGCYNYMNCISNDDYAVEVGNYATYINVGDKSEKVCPF
jgi:hypothetical protein